MKNGLKKALCITVALLMLISVLPGSSMNVEASSKKQVYSFSSCTTSTFTKKNGRLTVKAAGKSYIKCGKKTRKKIKFKVSKNCKWQEKYVDRRHPGLKTTTEKSSYKKIKKAIKFDYKWLKEAKAYNNVAECYVVVKNKKIIKVVYEFA